MRSYRHWLVELLQNTHGFKRSWLEPSGHVSDHVLLVCMLVPIWMPITQSLLCSCICFHWTGSNAFSEARRPSLCIDANLHQLLLEYLQSFLLFLQSDLLLVLLGKNMVCWIYFHLFAKGRRSWREFVAGKICSTYWLELEIITLVCSSEHALLSVQMP